MSFKSSFQGWADFNADNDLLLGEGLWRRFGKKRRVPTGPGPDEFEWDPETAMPIGMDEAPAEGVALKFQWRAGELTRRRNAQLLRQGRDEAMAFLGQGARASESYRPGGHASFNSYGARANLAWASAMARQIDEPDMLLNWRAGQSERALADMEAARRRESRGNILQLAGTVIGAIYGGGAGAAAGGALGSKVGQVGEGGSSSDRAARREAVIGGTEPYYD